MLREHGGAVGVGVRVSVKIHTVYNKLLQTVNKRCVSVLVVVVVFVVGVIVGSRVRVHPGHAQHSPEPQSL